MASFYPENIPQEMKDTAQWVLWRVEQEPDKKIDPLTGEIKLTKVPYKTNGRRASSTAHSDWSSFEEAFAAYNPSNYAGLGFVFTKENGFVAVDFDHVPHDCASPADGCTTEGWDEGVLAEISDFNSYAELSQSGEGAHVFCKGTLPQAGSKKGNHEMYCDKRFFAVTGNHINKTPVTLNEAQECITDYYEMWFEQGNTNSKSLGNPNLLKSPEMTDEEVLLHCQKAANSEKFNRLHSGDIGGYHSNSEAQHAYCCLLSLYTKNIEQIDRMLRASVLHDKKWDRRGKYTLEKIRNGLTEVYQKMPSEPETSSELKENFPVEEITQEEINKIRADRYSPRIPNLHKILDEHHLINVYCDWISSLSDTYYEYQVGSVFWLLSALTQGKVCLRAKQEVIKPNLWSFFLGRSTTSRKSTAINKVKDIFTNATDSELFNDEFSIEGYLKLLSKYPVNNIVRDEAGGLLAKSYKKYNDGIFDIECLVYDGQGVRKTLAKEEVTIINPFVTHLYGTTLDTFTSVMQLSTVLGGYGFRFLYFAPDYIKPRKDIDIETEEDIEKWAEILTRVKKLKKFFDSSDVINFKVEPEAFKNYNQVIANLETTIDNIGDSMLNSALGRYQVYILKLAMLIEIGKPEPSFTIHQDSMSLAVSLVVDYFLPSYQDIIERLEEDIKFNQIEKVVSTLRKLGNTAPRHKLLKNSKIKQKDFDEVITTLVASKTLTIKTITGTGGSNGEIFILEDVKLDLRAAIYQHPSFPSFPSFPYFTHVTNKYIHAVKEGKEAKTDIESASRLCFTSDMGEIGERREIRETSKIPETEEIQIVNSSVVSEEEGIRILKEEGF